MVVPSHSGLRPLPYPSLGFDSSRARATMLAMPTPRCCVCLVPVRAAHATPTPYCSLHQPPVKVAADGRATTSGGCRLHGHADWYEPKRRCRICDAEAKRRRRSA